MAQHLWSTGLEADWALAGSFLEGAAQILFYDRFDFVDSSSWPWTSFEVLYNLYSQQTWEQSLPRAEPWAHFMVPRTGRNPPQNSATEGGEKVYGTIW